MKTRLGQLACCLAIVGLLAGAAGAEEAAAQEARAHDVNAAPAPAPAAAVAPESPFAGPAPDLLPLPPEGSSGSSSDRPFGDGRRTLSAFPRNLGRSFVGVFSRESLTPLFVGGAAAFASQRYDDHAANALRGQCLSCGRTGARIGGAAMVPVVGLLFTAGRFTPAGSTFRAASYDMAQALVVNAAWTGALKYSFHRQRPDGSDSLSLPSGHSSTAFALATVTERHYGWKVGLPAYALAAGISLSRIESNKHYLSDVLAGATIGTIVGRTVARVNGERTSRRTLAVTPATDAHGTGVGVGFSATW
jgi:membrane-associated phospholipid phosphatase